MRIFRSRERAGYLLADRLKRRTNRIDFVFAVPRGGIVTGAPIAERFGCPLIPVFVSKVRHPMQPEFAIGSVDESGRVNVSAIHRQHIPEDLLLAAIEDAKKVTAAKKSAYLDTYPTCDIRGKTIVLVDDGLATGETCRAALKFLGENRPASLILAVPCSSRTGANKVRGACDEFISFVHPDPGFSTVSQFYEQFPEVTHEQVVSLLQSLNSPDRVKSA